MTRDEHLKYCVACVHKKMDRDKGIVCSLTEEWANFDPTCPDFQKEIIEKEESNSFYIVPKKKKNKRELINAQIIMGLITLIHFVPLVVQISNKRFRMKVLLVSFILVALYGLCVGFIRKAPLLCTIFMLSIYFIGMLGSATQSGNITRAFDLVDISMLVGLVYCLTLVNGNITQSYKA